MMCAMSSSYCASSSAASLRSGRAIVSNLDAKLRVVAAGLGGSVIPRQVASRSEKLRDTICFRVPEALTAAASRMVEFLASKVD